jgi:antitoxin component YwqK of YwqJK toxin-antitoxin module/Tfp pilus assembly protein PilF
MKHLKFLVLSLILFAKISIAQKTGLVNSGELIKHCGELYDSAKYKEALPLLNTVSRSDTNYVWSQYEKSINLEADSQYSEAVKCCQQALALKEQRDYEPDLYNTYGNSLMDMAQYDKALQVFDSAIVKYPAYSLLYFNKGVCYLAMKRPADAEVWFQKSLLINPYMYSAHYQLGLAALQQGKIVPAFLSFIGYLLVNPSGKYWSESVTYLSKIARSTDDILDVKNKRTINPDDNYQAVEDILLSKIALDKGYKSLISLDDPIPRQIQAVFEKLDYNEKDKDFWIQYYMPYYKQVFTSGKFELFIYQLFSNVNATVIQDYVKKNKKELVAFRGEAGTYFDLLRSTRVLPYKDRDTVAAKYIYENGVLAGKGVLQNNGKMLTGPWIIYYNTGNIKAAGNYTSTGQRDGEWLYYFFDGTHKGTERYKNGKLEGAQDYWFENGNMSSHNMYANDKPEGNVTGYYYAGNMKSTVNYKLGKKEGEEKEFYSNGNIETVNNYINDELSGAVRGYYKSGQLKEVEQYVNGKADGPYKSYEEDGSLSSEGLNSNNKAIGEWKFYYPSGKIKEKHNYVNDVEEGLHQEYFEDGQLSASYMVKKGKIDGESAEYFEDGKTFAKYVYEKGIIRSAKFYDRYGNILGRPEQQGDLMDLVTYTLDGVKKSHAFYDQKGNVQGPDTIFYPSGKINEIKQYRNDTLNGPTLSYFLNGNKKFEINVVDGKDNGYYTSFYANGQPESEGWIQDDDYQGEWLFYNEGGKLTSRSYYLNGDLNGYKEEYYPDGKKTLEEKYHLGWLEQMTQYDDAGKVIAVDSFPKISGKYRLLYPGGQLMAETNYVNGDFDGPYKTFYFDGSAESSFFYKRGVLDSAYKTWYYGGARDDEGQYKYGNRWGIWKYYGEDGKLITTTTYKNDNKNGDKIYYFPNGNIDYASAYKDDELDGAAKKYDPDGSLAYQVNYEGGNAIAYTYLGKDGKLLPLIPIPYNNGSLKAYYQNGKLSRECTFSDGVLNGRDIVYYSNGQVCTSDTLAYGLFNGIYKAYNPNGKQKSVYNYIIDDADGICREYDEDGILKEEISYEHGSFRGPTRYYDKNGKIAKTLVYYYGKLIAAKNE